MAFGFHRGRGRVPTIDLASPAPEDAVRLAARIRLALPAGGRVVLFTGAREGDGVTTVASRVALALAQMDQGTVLALDANARRPSLAPVFGLEPGPGLSDVTLKRATLDEAIQVTEVSCLSVLPMGSPPADPVRLFAAAGLSEALAAVRSLYRFSVLDSAPLLQFADTSFLASMADAVVVTLAAGKRRRAELRAVQDTLAGLGATTLGVVLFDSAIWTRR